MNCVVLVVDFEPRSAALTKALLEPRGCEVHVAGTTRDLEAFLAKEFPAVVVLEPMLPGLDGFRFIRALKARKGGRVPVVVTASRIFKGQRYKTMGREAGADLVLERPQDDPQLVAAVDRVVAQLGDAPGRASNDTAALGARSGPASGPVGPAGGERVPLEFKAPLTVRSAVTSELDPAATIRTTVPGGAPEQELDQLVDRMFESCFDKAPEAEAQPAVRGTVALAPGEAPRAAAPRTKADGSTRELLSTLEEIENSLPQGQGKRGSASPREVETSVPLAPPPRSEDERSLDEVLEKITGQVPPVAAPRPSRKAPEPAASTPAATSGGFSGVLSETPSAEASPLYKKLLIPAVLVIVVVAGAVFMLNRGSAPASTTPPTESAAPTTAPAPVEPAGQAAAPATAPAPAASTATPPAAPPATAPATAAVRRDTVQPDKPADTRPAPATAPPSAAKAAETTTAPPTTPEPVAAQPTPAPVTPPQPEPVAPKVEEAPAAAAPTPEPAPAPAAAAPAPAAAEPEGPPVPGVNGVSRPQLISRTEPIYPAVAKARGIKGTVILRLKIRTDGSVGDVTVLREPEGSALGRASAAAVRNWRYKPAMQRGRPVEVEFTQTVTFN